MFGRHLTYRIVLAVLVVLATAGAAGAQNGRIVGVVLDERGEGVRGAIVVAQNPDLVPSSFTVTTDSKGRFAMIGLRSGPWTIVAQAPGYTGAADAVMVRQGASPNLPTKLTLQKVTNAPSALGAVSVRDLQAELSAADQLYDSHRWDEAILAYRTVLTKTPALSAINLQIAAAYRSKGDFTAAIDAYNDLLKSDPNSDRAKIGLAMANLEKGDLREAERTLEAAAQSPGATREVFYNLAEIKLSKKDVNEAARAYTRAAEVDPFWGKPVYGLGRVALSRGDAEGAAKYFTRVIEVDPVSPEAAEAKRALQQAK